MQANDVIQGRTKAREVARPIRKTSGVVIGRNGEELRRNKTHKDEYHIPDQWKENGWSYQWNRVSVHGWEDRSEQIKMQDNGWRIVPASRFGLDREEDGDYIRRNGLVLMERPQILTDEANHEEHTKAMEAYAKSFTRPDVKDATVPEMARDMIMEIRRGRKISIKAEMSSEDIPEDE